MILSITGLHHVTAIATDPQRNLDFYAGLLGLRLVKRTVSFDDPGSYHFYFGDARGTAGTILTFFPWPDARPGIRGTGQIEATAFAIGLGSVGYWLERLRAHQVSAERAPVLWDKQTPRIVNNSEDDICRMFNDVFDAFGNQDVNLFPKDIETEHAKLSSFIYDNVNNGVYKAG
jgi:catechol 2,3-dioxygenase-like lactoylglutathione lyase family enzyme